MISLSIELLARSQASALHAGGTMLASEAEPDFLSFAAELLAPCAAVWLKSSKSSSPQDPSSLALWWRFQRSTLRTLAQEVRSCHGSLLAASAAQVRL